MDNDLEDMTHNILVSEIKKLRQGIRGHHNSSRNDLLWGHPRLWDLIIEKKHPYHAASDTSRFLERQIYTHEFPNDKLPGSLITNDLST